LILEKHVSIFPTEELRKIMKKDVVTVRPDDDIRHAAQLMEKHNIGCVVVVEDRKPLGVLTERDYVRTASRGCAPDTKVAAVMSTPPVTCESNKKAAEAYVLMATNRIDHLPITENSLLVGIVVVRDLFFYW
jgi:CBS domain-containing protein